MKFEYENMKKFSDLPIKYQQAIDDYLITNNQSESFRKIARKGISDSSLRKQCTRFYNNVSIVPIIQERKEELQRNSLMKPLDIIRELENIALGKTEDQFSEKTSVKDRKAALDTLAKINGMLTDKIDVNATTTVIVEDIKE